MSSGGRNLTRLQLCAEVISSERSYIASLEAFHDTYVRPLAAKWNRDATSEASEIFLKLDRDLSTVLMVARQLLSELEEADAAGEFENSIADVFTTWAPMFKSYREFVMHQRDVADEYRALMAGNKKFRALVASMTARRESALDRARPLDFESYLIMPIQRVPRYELLLNNILRTYPSGDAVDEHARAARARLEAALTAIRKAASTLNDSLTRKEAQDQLLAIARSIATGAPTGMGTASGGTAGGTLTRLLSSPGGMLTTAASTVSMEQDLVSPARRFIADAFLLMALETINTDCDATAMRLAGLAPRMETLQRYVNDAVTALVAAGMSATHIPVRVYLFSDTVLLTLPKTDVAGALARAQGGGSASTPGSAPVSPTDLFCKIPITTSISVDLESSTPSDAAFVVRVPMSSTALAAGSYAIAAPTASDAVWKSVFRCRAGGGFDSSLWMRELRRASELAGSRLMSSATGAFNADVAQGDADGRRAQRESRRASTQVSLQNSLVPRGDARTSSTDIRTAPSRPVSLRAAALPEGLSSAATATSLANPLLAASFVDADALAIDLEALGQLVRNAAQEGSLVRSRQTGRGASPSVNDFAHHIIFRGVLEKHNNGMLGGWSTRFFVLRLADVNSTGASSMARPGSKTSLADMASYSASVEDDVDEEDARTTSARSGRSGPNGSLPESERKAVLKGMLEYYKDASSLSTGAPRAGAIGLSSIVSISYAPSAGAEATGGGVFGAFGFGSSASDRQRRFDIMTSSGRTYSLRAANEQDAKHWVRTLAVALELRNRLQAEPRSEPDASPFAGIDPTVSVAADTAAAGSGRDFLETDTTLAHADVPNERDDVLHEEEEEGPDDEDALPDGELDDTASPLQEQVAASVSGGPGASAPPKTSAVNRPTSRPRNWKVRTSHVGLRKPSAASADLSRGQVDTSTVGSASELIRRMRQLESSKRGAPASAGVTPRGRAKDTGTSFVETDLSNVAVVTPDLTRRESIAVPLQLHPSSTSAMLSQLHVSPAVTPSTSMIAASLPASRSPQPSLRRRSGAGSSPTRKGSISVAGVGPLVSALAGGSSASEATNNASKQNVFSIMQAGPTGSSIFPLNLTGGTKSRILALLEHEGVVATCACIPAGSEDAALAAVVTAAESLARGADGAADADMESALHACEVVLASLARHGMAAHALGFMLRFRAVANIIQQGTGQYSGLRLQPTAFMQALVVIAHGVAGQPLPALEVAASMLNTLRNVRETPAGVPMNAPRAIQLAVLAALAHNGCLSLVRTSLAALAHDHAELLARHETGSPWLLAATVTPWHYDLLVFAAAASGDSSKAEATMLALLESDVRLPARSFNTLLRSYADEGRVASCRQLGAALFAATCSTWDARKPGWREMPYGRAFLGAVDSWISATDAWLQAAASARGSNAVQDARKARSQPSRSRPSRRSSILASQHVVRNVAGASNDTSVAGPAFAVGSAALRSGFRCDRIAALVQRQAANAGVPPFMGGATTASALALLQAHINAADAGAASAVMAVLHAAVSAQAAIFGPLTSGTTPLSGEDDGVDLLLEALGLVDTHDLTSSRFSVPPAAVRLLARAHVAARNLAAAEDVILEAARRRREIDDTTLVELLPIMAANGRMEEAGNIYHDAVMIPMRTERSSPAALREVPDPFDDASLRVLRSRHAHTVFVRTSLEIGDVHSADSAAGALIVLDGAQQSKVAAWMRSRGSGVSLPRLSRLPSALGAHFWMDLIGGYCAQDANASAAPHSGAAPMDRVLDSVRRLCQSPIFPTSGLYATVLTSKRLNSSRDAAVRAADTLVAAERGQSEMLPSLLSSIFLLPEEMGVDTAIAATVESLPRIQTHIAGHIGPAYVSACVAADALPIAQNALEIMEFGGFGRNDAVSAVDLPGLLAPARACEDTHVQQVRRALHAIDPRAWPSRADLVGAYNSVITALAAKGMAAAADRLCAEMERSLALRHADEDGVIDLRRTASADDSTVSGIGDADSPAATLAGTYKQLMLTYGLQGKVTQARKAFESLQRIRHRRAGSSMEPSMSRRGSNERGPGVPASRASRHMREAMFADVEDLEPLEGFEIALGSNDAQDSDGDEGVIAVPASERANRSSNMHVSAEVVTEGSRKKVVAVSATGSRPTSMRFGGTGTEQHESLHMVTLPGGGTHALGPGNVVATQLLHAADPTMSPARQRQASMPLVTALPTLHELEDDQDPHPTRDPVADGAEATQLFQEGEALASASRPDGAPIEGPRASFASHTEAVKADLVDSVTDEDAIPYNALIASYAESGRVDLAVAALAEMHHDGACPDSATLVAMLHVHAAAGLGHRAMDVCAAVAEVMVRVGADMEAVKDVLHCTSVLAAVMYCGATEGRADIVQKAWDRFLRQVGNAADPHRHMSRAYRDMCNMFAVSTAVASLHSGLAPSALSADTPDKNTRPNAVRVVAGVLLKEMLGAEASGFGERLPADTRDATSGVLRPARGTHAATASRAASVTANFLPLASSLFNADSLAAIAVAARACTSRATARKLLASAVSAFAGTSSTGGLANDARSHRGGAAAMDSEAFIATSFALACCGQTADARNLVSHVAVSALTQALHNNSVYAPYAGGAAAAARRMSIAARGAPDSSIEPTALQRIAHAWYAAVSLRQDVAVTEAAWHRLQSASTGQEGGLSREELTIVAASDNVGSVPAHTVATALLPRSNDAPRPYARRPLDMTLTSASWERFGMQTTAADGEQRATSLSREGPPSHLAANLRLAGLVGSGRLADALVEFLCNAAPTVVDADSVDGVAHGSMPFRPLPELVTLLLQAVASDLGSGGASKTGMLLPAAVLSGLQQLQPHQPAQPNEPDVLIRGAEAYVSLVSTILARAREWGLHPRDMDLAAVVELHGACGNLRLGLTDIKARPSPLLYAALLRGMARCAVVSVIEAEYVARRMREDGVAPDQRIALAVHALGSVLRGNLNTMFSIPPGLIPGNARAAGESASASPLTPEQVVSSAAAAVGFVLARWRLLRLSEQIGDDSVPAGLLPRAVVEEMLTLLHAEWDVNRDRIPHVFASDATPSLDERAVTPPLDPAMLVITGHSVDKSGRLGLSALPSAPERTKPRVAQSGAPPTGMTGFEVFDRSTDRVGSELPIAARRTLPAKPATPQPEPSASGRWLLSANFPEEVEAAYISADRLAESSIVAVPPAMRYMSGPTPEVSHLLTKHAWRIQLVPGQLQDAADSQCPWGPASARPFHAVVDLLGAMVGAPPPMELELHRIATQTPVPARDAGRPQRERLNAAAVLAAAGSQFHLDPETLLLEESVRAIHAEVSKLELDLQLALTELIRKESSLNAEMAERDMWIQFAGAAGADLKPSTALHAPDPASAVSSYILQGHHVGDNAMLFHAEIPRIADPPTSLMASEQSQLRLRYFGELGLVAALRQLANYLRKALEDAETEENALVQALRAKPGAHDLYSGFLEATKAIAMLEASLTLKIAEDERRAETAEDAVSTSRGALRNALGRSAPRTIVTAGGQRLDDYSERQKRAMDAIADVSSFLLSQAARLQRRARDAVFGDAQTAVNAVAAVGAALASLHQSHFSERTRLRAVIGSFDAHLRACTSELDAVAAQHETIKAGLSRVTLRLEQAKRAHARDCGAEEDSVIRLRTEISQGYSNVLQSQNELAALLLTDAQERGRARGEAEGCRLLEEERAISEARVAAEAAAARNALGPAALSSAATDVRAAFRLEDRVEAALSHAASETGKRLDLASQVEVEETTLKAMRDSIEALKAQQGREAAEVAAMSKYIMASRRGRVTVDDWLECAHPPMRADMLETHKPVVDQLWDTAEQLQLDLLDLACTFDEVIDTALPALTVADASQVLQTGSEAAQGSATGSPAIWRLLSTTSQRGEANSPRVGVERDAADTRQFHAACYAQDFLLELYQAEARRLQGVVAAPAVSASPEFDGLDSYVAPVSLANTRRLLDAADALIHEHKEMLAEDTSVHDDAGDRAVFSPTPAPRGGRAANPGALSLRSPMASAGPPSPSHAHALQRLDAALAVYQDRAPTAASRSGSPRSPLHAKGTPAHSPHLTRGSPAALPSAGRRAARPAPAYMSPTLASMLAQGSPRSASTPRRR